MVLSVMEGFEKDLRDRIIGLDAHLVISGSNGIQNYKKVLERIEPLSEIKGASPYIEGEVLIYSREKSRGAILRGIDPDTASLVLDLEKTFQSQCIDFSLKECFSLSQGYPPILVGGELADDLRFFFDKTKVIKIVSPLGSFGPFGFEPRIKEYQVVDSFRSGFYDYDTQRVYVPLKNAQAFYRSGDRVTGIEIKLHRLEQVGSAKKELSKILTEFEEDLFIEDWRDRNQKLFSAMELEKIVMFIVLFLIVVVASFVILITMTMLVLEKRKEIAVLRTIGVSQKSIIGIFVLDGAIIGMTGALIGFLSGLAFCFLLDRYQFVQLPPEYYVTTIPIVYQWGQLIFVPVASIFIAVLATLYPAFKGGKTDPVEVLRYE